MKFVSYAPNFADVLLWRAFREVGRGCYVDVGAEAPQEGSFTYAFHAHGWHGVNVTADIVWFEMLRELRPEDANLYARVIDPVDGGDMLPVITLDAVCAKHAADTIHFLRVNAAGAEAAVIASFDLGRYRPRIILVTVAADDNGGSQPSWEALLAEQGYSFVWFDGLNRFYVAEECSQLQLAFSTPPNHRDDFIAYAERRQQEQLAGLQAQLDNWQRNSATEFQPPDLSVLEPLAWPGKQQDEQVSTILLQTNAGMNLLFQHQQQMTQAIWQLARRQAEQAALEAERLRQYEADYQRYLFEREQEKRQWHSEQQQRQQHWQQERQHWQQQHEALARDKAHIAHELQDVYRSKAWRITWPLRQASHYGKPVLRRLKQVIWQWLGRERQGQEPAVAPDGASPHLSRKAADIYRKLQNRQQDPKG